MAFCSQFFRMLLIFIKLKSWKFIFLLIVLAATWSNNFLFEPIDGWILRFGEQDLQIVGPKEYMENVIVVGDVTNSPAQFGILGDSVARMTKTDKFVRQNIEGCQEGSTCNDKYFQLLAGRRKGKLAHHIDFSSKDGRAKLQCQVTSGTELFCPFSAYLVGLAQQEEAQARYEYNETSVFRLISTMRTYSSISGGNKTVCKTNLNFPIVFPKTVMAQMLLIIGTLGFYLLVSTVTTVYELKQNGFLQLMFRRHMSVMAYWMPLWLITLLELIIVAAVLTVSYSVQCSGFFATPKLTNVFLCTFLQFCCLAACILLLTILSRSIVITSFLTCLLLLATGAIIVANRIFLSSPNSSKIIKYILLVLPFGHIAEQVHETLLKGHLPSNAFIGLVLPVSGALFAVVLILTIYLDSVLTPGNGRKFPCGYLFNSRFWSLYIKDRVTIETSPSSVMVEDVSDRFMSTLLVGKLKKSFAPPCFGTTANVLSDITVQFYRDQITAIIGHNGSGKSILMQILSGERHATSGRATFNKLLITDPLCRYHLGNDIGYCPQNDALVERLTVIDTLKLVASSSGFSWDDVYLDVQAVLSTLLIEDKLNHCIGSLSSSDKRKVCVTMALIGKPKVVLLDSPSTDMDFISKRRMWKLLHEYKIGRTVIFSTLFMDEADGMADRMVFLSGGRVICAGSSFFFKRAFDCRYIIQIASKTEFHVPSIIRIITSKFPTIRVRSVGSADVEFEVSQAEDKILPDVIQEVEGFAGVIDEFGIATFCLDEVFCKFKDLSTAEIEQHFRHSTVGYLADDYERIMAIKHRPELRLPEGPRNAKRASNALRTTAALMMSSCKQTWRSKSRFLFRVLVPLLFILLVVGAAVLEKMAKNDIKVRYNLSNTSEVEREKGVCMHYFSYDFNSDGHLESIIHGECGRYITGANKSNDKVHGLEMDVTNEPSFVQSVLKYLPFIRKKCGKTPVPCPVVFSTDWCPHRSVSNNQQVYVGSYISKENYTAESVASTAIEVFKNMVAFLTLQITNRNYSVQPDFDTEGLVSVASIFYRFYGQFAQIAFLSVIPAICLVDVMQDMQSGVRRQLITMGISRLRYWLCTLLSHWIYLTVIYLICTASLIIVVSVGYKSMFYLIAVMAPTLTFGLINSLLFVYVISMLVSNSYMCVVIYVFCCLVVAMSALIVQTDDLAGQIMIFVFPQYAAMAPTFYGVKFIYYSNAYYATQSSDNMRMLRHAIMPGRIRDSYMALAAHFLVLVVLMLILENVHHYCCRCDRKYKADLDLYEDCKEPTITEEVKLLRNCPKQHDHIMEANNLKVVSPLGEILLKNLTFGLKFGEIVGLLGPCGSGKGAALRAMVGDQHPSAGRVDFHVIDRWLSSESAMMQGFVGYCPKYNPHVQGLTVRENLQFYARAVGVPLERVQQIVRNFSLQSEVNTIAMHATEAVKRRLSLAIAVLTSPRVLVIDQATAGVDPEGRQIIWQTIKSLACRQRGLLIATQFMEEAETLCGRICILNAGMMAALNTIDDLIARYKKMYFIEVQLGHLANESESATQRRKEDLVKAVLGKFYGSLVIEQLTFRIQFGVPISSIGCLSSALTWIVNRKEMFHVLYFTIHYATIDQTMKCIIVHHETEMLSEQEENERDHTKA